MDLSKVTEITPRIEKLLAAESAGYKFIGSMQFQVEVTKNEETGTHRFVFMADKGGVKATVREIKISVNGDNLSKEDFSRNIVKPMLEHAVSVGHLRVANVNEGEVFFRKDGSKKFYYNVDFIVKENVRVSEVAINKSNCVVAV